MQILTQTRHDTYSTNTIHPSLSAQSGVVRGIRFESQSQHWLRCFIIHKHVQRHLELSANGQQRTTSSLIWLLELDAIPIGCNLDLHARG